MTFSRPESKNSTEGPFGTIAGQISTEKKSFEPVRRNKTTGSADRNTVTYKDKLILIAKPDDPGLPRETDFPIRSHANELDKRRAELQNLRQESGTRSARHGGIPTPQVQFESTIPEKRSSTPGKRPPEIDIKAPDFFDQLRNTLNNG